MRTSLTAKLTCGLLAMTLPQIGIAAEMDKPIFELPARYGPVEGQRHNSGASAVSGFVEGSFNYGRGEADGFSADGTRWALRGSVNAGTGENWNIQIDGLYNRTSVDPVEIDTLAGAAHVYYRVPDAYAVGAFVQASRFGSNVLDLFALLGGDDYALDLIGGGEAAIYTDMVTLHGGLGFGRVSYSGLKADHLLAKGGARFYATDNLRLDLDGMWNRLSGYGGHADVYTVSATGNYRFDQWPATVFAGYQYDAGEISAGGVSLGKADAHTFLTGLRFSFGSKSLKDEERNGPAWSPSALNL
jgi:hypothetical protein